MLAYFTASLTFPSLIGDTVVPAADTAGTAPVPYFQIPIEPLMSVTSSLVLAFVLGFGCAVLGQSAARLKGVIDDFRSVINLIIAKVIVPLLPIYIFGIFMSMTIEGAVGPVLMTFVRIIAVIFVLHVLVLVLQYLVAAFFSGYNPFKSLWTMLPAYVTALGTQSSAATNPCHARAHHGHGCQSRYCRFRHSALCHDTHVGFDTQDCVVRRGLDARARACLSMP